MFREQEYKGYRIERMGMHLYVYEGRLNVFCTPADWDGVNGWRVCRQWIDSQLWEEWL